MIRRLADRAAYFWHCHRPARRETADLVSYAIQGVLAKHGPSTLLDVAKILGRRPAGTLMDLAVMERVWGTVVSEWVGEPPCCLYRVAETKPQVRDSFWDDLRQRYAEESKFRKGFDETTRKIQAFDAQANGEDGTQ